MTHDDNSCGRCGSCVARVGLTVLGAERECSRYTRITRREVGGKPGIRVSRDVDPAALIHLMRTEGLSPDDLDGVINRESGLLGLSGVSNDMREIEKAAQEGHHRALLAFKTFCYQIRKYIGAYVAAMQGLDAVIFTGGIGQGSAGVRSLACQGLGYMGIQIDEDKNQNADGFKHVRDISADDSPVQVLVVPSDEERMIARETLRALKANNITNIN